ncbi:MAG: Fic family protein [Candidatus Brocadiaceae bacterium]|nr:Fic family protein [Candidatus Brocadiaceae bacterium]
MLNNPACPHNLALLPPELDLKNQIFTDLITKARVELAELKGFSFSMPNPMLLLSPAIIKESVASSEIENINTTVIKVLQYQLFQEKEQTEPDKEVLRYKGAVISGFENLKKYAISTRLILDVQKKLMPTAYEGYRNQQNQIINSSNRDILYTPPLPSEIPNLMSNWEKYVNQPNGEIDPLIRSAIAHYQFEAIHPFGDGNGRTGRILMVLQLVNEKVLTFPILYISGYINSNRSEYYKLLGEVTSAGNWNDYILFMLKGFYLQAVETKLTLFAIMELFFEFKDALKKKHKKIYSADFVEVLFSYPIIVPAKLATELNIHRDTASKYLLQLANVGLLKESRQGRYHLFINEKLMKILKK